MLGNHQEVDSLIEKMKQEIADEGIQFEEKVVFKEPNEQGVTYDCCLSPELHYFFELSSSHKLIGKFVVGVKRVIRKSIRFLIIPIISEQSEFNRNVVMEINRLNEIIIRQGQKIDDLEKKLEQNNL